MLGALRSSAERSVYDTLRLAHLAVRPLREGLGERSAGQAARAIRNLLSVGAVALADTDSILSYQGIGSRHHGESDPVLTELAASVASEGRTRSVPAEKVCGSRVCGIGEAAGIPIKVGNETFGALLLVRVMGKDLTLGLLRAGREVARQAGLQLALAEGDRTRQELVRAQTEALRAQISPHFAYNTLTAAASLVRRDPERARELLVQFAEFSRYILRNDRVNTTLADELHNVHTYLELERARYTDRLEVVFRVDPGVLPVVVPVLILQPLVENAILHGIEGSKTREVVTILAEDRDEEVYVSVSDTGSGMDSATLSSINSWHPAAGSDHLGLRNVQERLRTTYGERYRLTIESEVEEGTRVSFCVPKFRAGVTV
jgi:two-component system LytT family sensor kinase